MFVLATTYGSGLLAVGIGDGKGTEIRRGVFFMVLGAVGLGSCLAIMFSPIYFFRGLLILIVGLPIPVTVGYLDRVVTRWRTEDMALGPGEIEESDLIQ